MSAGKKVCSLCEPHAWQTPLKNAIFDVMRYKSDINVCYVASSADGA
jgi:hypothetical protein